MTNIVNVLTHVVHAPMSVYRRPGEERPPWWDSSPLCGVDVPQGYGGTEKPVTCKRCLKNLAGHEVKP